jgi:hypothetical protein
MYSLVPGLATGSDRYLVCTSYLSTSADPQRGRFRRPDCFEYMRSWYDSMQSLDLRGFVLHDGLTPAFVNRYQTDRIRFVRVPPSRWSTNDARFFAYRRLLARRDFSHAFLTDISDVTIVRDPFRELVRRRWRLVIGDEAYPSPMGRTIRTHPWLIERICQTRSRSSMEVFHFFSRRWFDLPTLNAGVIGGRAPEIRRFLDSFVRTRTMIGHPDRTLNMPLVNYIFHRQFAGRFHAGAPVTSRFKRFERNRRDVWFIHK